MADDEQLYAAARLYYEHRRSQQEVAEALGVSRSTVSRLLTEARQRGIVRIQVIPPSEPAGLGEELTRRLGLRRARVCPAPRRQEAPWAGLAAAAGDALASEGLRSGDVLLAAWGRTTWEVSQQLECPLPGVIVAPMMGGSDEPMPWFHTNEIVQQLARRIGGEAAMLHAPAQPSVGLRRELERDEATLRTLRLWDQAAVALVGIGGPPAVIGDHRPAHHPRDRAALHQAAGDVASRYFDSDGRPVGYDDEARLLGVSRQQLLQIPTKVAVASGTVKAPSIVGAAAAGLVDVLVTDTETAEAVLSRLAADAAPAPAAAGA